MFKVWIEGEWRDLTEQAFWDYVKEVQKEREQTGAREKNPFFLYLGSADLRWAAFWILTEQEWAEEQKRDLYYGDCDLEEEEEEICDYTGEECCGDKMFCEECWVLHEGEP